MPDVASFASRLPAAAGAVVGCMAIGGFVRQALPAIRGADENQLGRGAAIGGMVGLGAGFIVAVCQVRFRYMSHREIRLNTALGLAGVVATAVVVLGLNALGATYRLLALGAIVVLVLTSIAGWFIPEDPPQDRR